MELNLETHEINFLKNLLKGKLNSINRKTKYLEVKNKLYKKNLFIKSNETNIKTLITILEKF